MRERESFPEVSTASLAWQSRLVLLLTLPAASVYAAIQFIDVTSLTLLAAAAGFSLGLASLVLLARAATAGAALLGALFAFCLALTPSFPHSPLWPLTLMLVLTLGASRFARHHREMQGLVEPRHGRTAAQVAANLGVAALTGSLINSSGTVLAHAALLAALGEAAADTLASELGPLGAATPRMLLTGRRVPAGTDGAVSMPGSAAGLLGVVCLCLVARWAFALPWWAVLLGSVGSVFGFFFDSLLGQLIERRGWLNNDAVNLLSTLAAALVPVLLGRLYF